MQSTIQFYPSSAPRAAASDIQLSALPPLSLYIHIPWCVRKCPYCDFNSHELGKAATDWEAPYVQALIADLESVLPQVWGRRLSSIFIGGGTPSLLSERAMDELLVAVRARLPHISEMEITMEANPGTLEVGKLRGFRDAGVNRLSLGVQSFDDELLRRIGRIHSADQAKYALEQAYALFPKVNLDLMFALPEQTMAQLRADVATALSFAPTHLSYYHMTIEPNTLFHRHPPRVPDDELALDMQDYIQSELARAGLRHYEVSAYAQPQHECQHNTNYWQFGDYIGIGAGAHGKITVGATQQVLRRWKVKHPTAYLAAAGTPDAIGGDDDITPERRPFEFMLNALRLQDGFALADFTATTGLPTEQIATPLEQARQRGWLALSGTHVMPTALGRRFTNDVIELFLDR